MYQGLAYDIAAVVPAAVATGLLVSVASFAAPSGNCPNGTPDGVYVAVSGLQNIPCTAPPPSNAKVTATEVKELEKVTSMRFHHVWLGAWYPQIESQTDWRVTIDGTDWDVMGAESDSQHTQTRVMVRIAAI
jgi:hypothetical protein